MAIATPVYAGHGALLDLARQPDSLKILVALGTVAGLAQKPQVAYVVGAAAGARHLVVYGQVAEWE